MILTFVLNILIFKKALNNVILINEEVSNMNYKKTLKYIISFIIPIILLLAIFALLGIYPFGQKDLLWFDTQAQYIDFLSYWQDVIRGQASIFYSFGKNLGGDMFGLFTYYLTSPIDLIILLFKKIDLPQAFMLIILIKIGLCGSSFRYYLEHSRFLIQNKNSKIIKLIFSCCYALLSFNIVYCMSHMWLDCVMMLPLIFLGIEHIVEEKKWGLYLASFTFAIIGNYYVAFMIAIFTIPYFIYMLLWNNQDKKIKEIILDNKDKIWLYIRMSLIAVLIAGIIIIPTIYSLTSSKGKLYSSSNLVLYMYFDYFTLFAKEVLGSFSMNELRVGAPNIYAGILPLLLTILYFLNNKITNKEKIYSGIFLFIFFICFYFNPINLFMHMLQSPMSFPFRYSFIFSFLSLVYAYKCYERIDGLNKKTIIMSTIALIFIFMIVDKNAYEYLVNWKVFITILLVIIYSIFLHKIDNIKKIGYIFLAIIVCIELILNGYLLMQWMPYGDRMVYRNHIEKYTPVYEYLKGIDKGLYRISYNDRKSLDDALMYDFAGLEHYSSVGEKSTEEFLVAIGYEGSPLVEYGTGTILDNSLLGVEYVLSTSQIDFYLNEKTINDVYIYKNPYALPFGYLSSEQIYEYNNKYSFSSPFEYQNYIFGLITGNEQKYFDVADYEIVENSNVSITEYTNSMIVNLVDASNVGYIDFKIKTTNEPLYTYIAPDSRGQVSYVINDIEKQISESNITYVGCSEDEVTLRMIIYGQTTINKNFIQYLKNEITIPELIKLYDNKLEIEKYDDTYIKGTIKVDEKANLFTTIPYEKGWTILVNGKKTDFIKALDTFISIELEPGENIIEFKYESPGVTKGLIISIFGIVFLGIEILLLNLNKKEYNQIENIQETHEKNEKVQKNKSKVSKIKKK